MKPNEKRALRDRLTDEATTWLDDRACEYRYDYERIVDEMVDLLIAHRSAAERRAYRSLARWAVKRASQKQWALTVARQAGRSLTAECRQSDVETLLGVADECRRRAKGKA